MLLCAIVINSVVKTAFTGETYGVSILIKK